MPTDTAPSPATTSFGDSAAPMLTLGAGMSRRSRSQSVLAAHRTSATLIGAVGRASVGFGLAVGRSRAIRPMVNLSDVNTAALRPPTNFWREQVVDEPFDESGFAPSGSTRSATSRPVSTQATPTSQQVAQRSVRGRPTWTDQVIQRSAIGYTPAARNAITGPTSVPDDFESFGDPKLDQLRLLLRSSEDGPTNSPAPQRAARASSRQPATKPDDGASGGGSATTPGSGGGRRGDTAAGESTGPGRLATSMRPEPTTRSNNAGIGGRPAPGAAIAPEPPSGGRAGQPIRRSRTTADAPAPSKMDTLRQLLLDQGVLSDDGPGEPTAGADASPDPDSDATAGSRRGGARGPGSHRSDPATIRRAPAGDSGRGGATSAPGGADRAQTSTSSELRGAARRSAAVTPTPTGEAARPGRTGPDARIGDGTTARSRASVTDVSFPGDLSDSSVGTSRVGDARGPGGDRSGPATIRRVPAGDSGPGSADHGPASTGEAIRSGQTDRAVRVGDTATTRSGASFGDPSSPMNPSDPSVAARRSAARRVRSERMMASGFVPRSTDTDGAPTTPTAPSAAAMASSESTNATMAAADGQAVRSAATVRSVATVRPALPWSDTFPALPTATAGSTATIRRVTLPRALSSAHRPVTTFMTTASRSDMALRGGGTDVAPALIESAPVSLRSSATSSAMRDAATAIPATENRPTENRTAERTIENRPTEHSAIARQATERPTGDSSKVGVLPALPVVSPPRAGSAAARSGDATSTSTSPAVVVRPAASTAVAQGVGPIVQRREATDAVAQRSAPVAGRTQPTSPTRRTIGRSVLPAGVGALHEIIRRSAIVGEQPVTGEPVTRVPARSRRQEQATVVAEGAESSVMSREHHVAEHHTVQRQATERQATERQAPERQAPERQVEASRRPAERLAEQFMTELSQTVRRSSAPLPMPFRPMADEITGGRRVMLSTDGASRRALRSVGKVAATTGDTIHLDRSAIPQLRIDEVVAHELTHVAHPSPAPRFFDDIDDSPEERRAEQIATIMAKSPLAPSAPVAAPRAASGGNTLRRSPAAPTSSSSSDGSMSAESLAARLGGASSTTSAGSGEVIRRFGSRSSSSSSSSSTWQSAQPSSSSSSSSTIGSARPSSSSSSSSAAPSSSTPPSSAPAASPTQSASTTPSFTFDNEAAAMSWFRDQLRDNLGLVLHLIEDQMVIELERRGGRIWGGL